MRKWLYQMSYRRVGVAIIKKKFLEQLNVTGICDTCFRGCDTIVVNMTNKWPYYIILHSCSRHVVFSASSPPPTFLTEPALFWFHLFHVVLNFRGSWFWSQEWLSKKREWLWILPDVTELVTIHYGVAWPLNFVCDVIILNFLIIEVVFFSFLKNLW